MNDTGIALHKFLFQIGAIKSDTDLITGDVHLISFYSKLVRLKVNRICDLSKSYTGFYSKLVRLKVTLFSTFPILDFKQFLFQIGAIKRQKPRVLRKQARFLFQIGAIKSA